LLGRNQRALHIRLQRLEHSKALSHDIRCCFDAAPPNQAQRIQQRTELPSILVLETLEFADSSLGFGTFSKTEGSQLPLQRRITL
jgi:phospholipase C